MVSFTSILLAASTAASVLGMPSALTPRYTSSGTGTSNGYYYSFWTDGTAEATYTNGAAGEYAVTWSGNVGNFVGGKGWATGSARYVKSLLECELEISQMLMSYYRAITYTSSFTTTGNAYLSVYGWTESPLIEY